MTTAIATPPVTAAHAPQQSSSALDPPRSYTSIAPSNTPLRPTHSSSNHGSPNSSDGTSQRVNEPKRSPNSLRNNTSAPKVAVKKEPTSPELPTGRHRPRRLELANNGPIGQTTLTARGPLTARESAGLAIQDVGLACLSPGFHTQDPSIREQLQRSIDVKEQQRQLIEARQKNPGKTPQDNGESSRHGEYPPFRPVAKTPGRRKGPPPGLSIDAPSHQQFASERVIQSAPLNQSFTGLRQPGQPLSRQVVNQPSSLSHTSHIHHVPATQTNNRLPPISDVFAAEGIGRHNNQSPGHSSHSNVQPPLPSPGFPPSQQQHPATTRPREYKSAEDAVQSLSGGREELMPKIVRYGGHQPPTPPSPMPPHGHANYLPGSAPTELHRTSSARRRGREEYERDAGSPPLGRQAETRRPGPFGEGRDSPETQQKKKDEFIQLCARAWDLFHS